MPGFVSALLHGHDLRVVAAAVALCLASAAVGFRALDMGLARGRSGAPWLALAALVFGLGVWTTHFTAMLGYRPDLLLGFRVAPTAASALIAVLGAGGGLALGALGRSAALGGAWVGGGVSIMHAVGVAGMTGCAPTQSPVVATLAGAVCGLCAAAALRLRTGGPAARFGATLALSGGVAILHFGSIAATRIGSIDPGAVEGLARGELLAMVLAAGAALLTAALGSLAVKARAEARHRELSALATHATDALAALSPTGAIRWVNLSFARMTGHDARAAQGRDFIALLRGPDSAPEALAALRAAIEATCGDPVEIRLRRADGETYAAVVAIGPVRDAAGRLTGLVCSHRDVTEKRAREAMLADARADAERARRRLIAAIEELPAGFGLYDASGRTLLANGALRQAAPWADDALTRDEAMRRAAALGRLAVADPDAWMAERAAAFARDGVDGGEVALSNGRTLWVQRRRLESDETVEIVLDVTERALRESELTDARNRAEAASRAKSSFLSVMSHELRTPLNGAIGLAGLLGTEPLTDRQRRLVEMIVESGGLLLRILSDMLDLAALEQASVALELAPVDLAALVDEAAGPARLLAERKGLAFEVDAAAVAGVRVMADARRLSQILGALLDNAVKFTEQGRATLTAAARRDEDGRVEVRFTVADTGVGVSEQARAHLFDVFAQADGSATRRFGGIGAGLTICRGLVDLMGGTIGMDSAPGAGSAFTVRLTLDDAAPAAARAIA